MRPKTVAFMTVKDGAMVNHIRKLNEIYDDQVGIIGAFTLGRFSRAPHVLF